VDECKPLPLLPRCVPEVHRHGPPVWVFEVVPEQRQRKRGQLLRLVPVLDLAARVEVESKV